MEDIPSNIVKDAVQAFLTSQYDKKTEKEQKQLEKAIADNDSDKIATLQQTLADAKEKYSKSVWLDDAVNRMARQLNFGTHISKGIHPDAKGDNISFMSTRDLPNIIVGTHSIDSGYIDANGNAAALPLASFFDFDVTDGIKIRDLILADNSDFIDSLHNDQDIAQSMHQTFKQALQNIITEPTTHERNKQTLWALNAYGAYNLDELEYINIIPLYPSVLTFEAYQRINHLKFSDENKLARDNRFKKTAEQIPYATLNNLATVQLGGTKPQNVSLLMSKQGGRNYLLPSLPPTINAKQTLFKPSKYASSIFSTSFANKVNPILQSFYSVVDSKPNNVSIRDIRKKTMDEILNRLFEYAAYMRTELPAGWTLDHELDEVEAFWLDPKRADLPNQEDWKAKREDPNNNWNEQIVRRFARWLNEILQAKFKDISKDFADPEHNEWERDMEAMQKQYKRAGKGVFL